MFPDSSELPIRFYHNDHEPVHFHAVYGEHEALIEIASLGSLPRRTAATGARIDFGVGGPAPFGTSDELGKTHD